ncbi:MAG TPA: helix-turn-helix domain-containing protein [Deferrisomatales bacterium]|nr:helix-turn-helix domain-containing protein [Deferrisomatales bacterium]
MSGKGTAAEQALVISHSSSLQRRITAALGALGVGGDPVPDPARLGRHRRKRPFLVCFVDARHGDGVGCWGSCAQQRPAERYVLVVGQWQQPGAADSPPPVGCGDGPFGYLREPFGGCEVRAWVRRATEETRHRRGDQSLEELLQGRFRHFLQNLGDQPMDSLHDLVWERVERPLINAVLERTGGNQSRAAEILGIHRNTLRAKIRSLGIDPGSWSGLR